MKAIRFLLVAGLLLGPIARADTVVAPAAAVKVALQFQGGHETDPRDHGRPVALIAAALGVPPDVFRDAFRHVHPAPAGEQPRPEDVRQNKRELLSRLAPYGVTNDGLDEVSNYYRYRPESGELWRHANAAGFAMVQGGRIVSLTITDPGSGYTTPPVVSVPGVALTVYPLATLTLSTELSKNGSIAKIELSPICDGKPAVSPPSSPPAPVIQNVRIESDHPAPPPSR